MSDGRPAPAQPAQSAGMSEVVYRNIRAEIEMRRRVQRQRSISDRVADTITAFAGSMSCVYFHALWFGAWIIVNCGWVPGIKVFDPYPFIMLAMIASVEAIFLSTFILVTQNRMQKMEEHRAELDLQVSLLSEHELTRVVQLVDAIAEHLNVPRPAPRELEEAKRDIDPRQISEAIAKAEDES